MATQTFELFEHNKATLAITVKDNNGDAVNLTGMKVYFYVHDLKEATDDGTNLIELDTDGTVTIVVAADGTITVPVTPALLVIDETVEDHIEAIWQVRYENSAGANDTDLLTLPQPFILRRNRVQGG